MKTSTGTGAFLVTYKGDKNSDYDGEQLVWNVADEVDAHFCVYDMLNNNDYDPEAFTITPRELGIDELAEMAAQGGDEGEDAADYLKRLEEMGIVA
jgi:hypothetical protein